MVVLGNVFGSHKKKVTSYCTNELFEDYQTKMYIKCVPCEYHICLHLDSS